MYSREGEIIGLYINKKIEKGLSARDTIREIKKQGGIVYIPHPYEPYRKDTVLNDDALESNILNVDCIEIHNGRNRKKFISDNQKEICEKYNSIAVIGSDAHTFLELGRNYMILENIEKDKILSSIKNSNIFSKKNCINISHFFTKIARFIKILEKRDIYELRRIINKKIKRNR